MQIPVRSDLRVDNEFTREHGLLLYQTMPSLRSAAWVLALRANDHRTGGAERRLPDACALLTRELAGLELWSFDSAGICFSRIKNGRLLGLESNETVDGGTFRRQPGVSTIIGAPGGSNAYRSISPGSLQQDAGSMALWCADNKVQTMPPPQGAAFNEAAQWMAANGRHDLAWLQFAATHAVRAHQLTDWHRTGERSIKFFTSGYGSSLEVYVAPTRRVLSSR